MRDFTTFSFHRTANGRKARFVQFFNSRNQNGEIRFRYDITFFVLLFYTNGGTVNRDFSGIGNLRNAESRRNLRADLSRIAVNSLFAAKNDIKLFNTL